MDDDKLGFYGILVENYLETSNFALFKFHQLFVYHYETLKFYVLLAYSYEER